MKIKKISISNPLNKYEEWGIGGTPVITPNMLNAVPLELAL